MERVREIFLHTCVRRRLKKNYSEKSRSGVFLGFMGDQLRAHLKSLSTIECSVMYGGVSGGVLNRASMMPGHASPSGKKNWSWFFFFGFPWPRSISHADKLYFLFLQMEWDMIVVTVFLSILNQMEFHLVQKIERKTVSTIISHSM